MGWQDFLAAEGVDDWVVLHGGATAVYRVESMRATARLAEAIVDAPGVADAGVLLTLSDTRITVRLTRDVWSLEPVHVVLARTVSAIAREHAAVPDRGAVQEVQVAIASKPDHIDVGFWRAVLGFAPMAPDNAVDPLGHGSTLADRAGNRVCVCGWPDPRATGASRQGDTYHALFRRLFSAPPSVVVTSSLVITEGHGWFLRRFDRVRALQILAMVDDMPFLDVRPVGAVELHGATSA